MAGTGGPDWTARRCVWRRAGDKHPPGGTLQRAVGAVGTSGDSDLTLTCRPSGLGVSQLLGTGIVCTASDRYRHPVRAMYIQGREAGYTGVIQEGGGALIMLCMYVCMYVK